MEKLSREETIALVGLSVVEAVERENCEPTNRLRNDAERNWVEWCASCNVTGTDSNGEEYSWVGMFYDVPQDKIDAAGDDLSNVDWANYVVGFVVA